MLTDKEYPSYSSVEMNNAGINENNLKSKKDVNAMRKLYMRNNVLRQRKHHHPYCSFFSLSTADLSVFFSLIKGNTMRPIRI